MSDIERPHTGDPRIKQMVIDKLAEECLRWSDTASLEEWKQALSRVHLHDNGFEIARDLDRYGRVNGINAELVEILDSASSYVWGARDKLVREWVRETGVKPSLAKGQRIKGRWHEGVITGFCEDITSYLMVPDDEQERFRNGGGHIIPYEEAELVEEQPA